MEIHEIKTAIEKHGSVRAAAKSLGIAHTTLNLWIARAGYQVKKTQGATIEPIPRPEK